MKRLIAVLLALSMTFYVAPLNALAASDGSLAQTITVTSQPDADLVQAIASDPFLTAQADSVPAQEQSATVDTSNVSMEATNSFGKLLMNGMNVDGENGSNFSSGNRVIGITMNGSTATVKYVAEEDADLVVGIYADDAEEQMVASGTVAVEATPENTGYSTVDVEVTGSIPSYFVTKGYLLDKTEHAPLSSAYVGSGYTQVIEDVQGATAADFPEERVINLDDDITTNFAVVAPGVVNVVEGEDDGEEENSVGSRSGKAFNTVLNANDETFDYVIQNPSNRVKYLREGQILTLRYGEGEVIVTRVKWTELNGDIITIHGEQISDLSDAFDLLKFEEESGKDGKEFEYQQGTAGEGATWLGETTSEIEETNGMGDHSFDVSVKVQQKFEFYKADYVEGTGQAGVEAKLHFYYSAGKTDASLTTKFFFTGKVTIKPVNIDPEGIKLGVYSFVRNPAVRIWVEPTLKFTAKVSVTGSISLEGTEGFECKNLFTDEFYCHDIGTDPVVIFKVEIEGEITVGIDIAPHVQIMKKVAELSVTAKFTLTMDFKHTDSSTLLGDNQDTVGSKWDIDQNDWTKSPRIVHGCKNCYATMTSFKLILGVSIKVLNKDRKWPDDGMGIDVPLSVGAKGYWSIDHNDFSPFSGSCPYNEYRVVVTMDAPNSAGKAIYCKKDGGSYGTQPIGYLNDNGWLQIYLEPGTYTLSDTTDDHAEERYCCTFAVTDFALNPTLKYAVRSGECGAEGSNLKWKISDNGMLVIEGEGEMQDYNADTPAPWPKDEVIGIEIQNGVTKIGTHAFERCYKLYSANISQTVKEIGESAFANCKELGLLNISGDIETIRKSAFENCGSLTNVKIAGNGKRIEERAFAGCEKLEKVELPEGLEELGAEVFSGCKTLEKVTLPTNVKAIPENAFSGCSALASIAFADDLASIGAGAFQNCQTLRTIKIPGSVETISESTFAGCSVLYELELAEGVKNIEKRAFSGCGALLKVSFPDTLETIGDYAFSDCSTLGREGFKPSGSLPSIGSGGYFPSENTDLILSDSLRSIGDYAFENCTSMLGVQLPDQLRSIGSYAFNGCTKLSNVSLPKNLLLFGEGVFRGCASITEIEIPDNVTRVAVNTFNGCTSLTKVTLPGRTEMIAEAAFHGCTALKQVDYKGLLADWFTIQIEDYNEPLDTAVIHCTDADTMGGRPESGKIGDNLKWKLLSDGTLTISGAGEMSNLIPWINDAEFRDRIQSVVIENGITSIGECAFEYCENLTSVSFPDSLTRINHRAFSGCTSLTEIVIPDSVTSFGDTVFAECKNLRKVKLPSKMTEIVASMFVDCTSLEEIEIPETVTKIKDFAFSQCGLKSIDIPQNVTEIEGFAFSWCNMKSVTIPEGVTTLKTGTFMLCTELSDITVPVSLTTVEFNTFDGCTNLESVHYAGTIEQWGKIEVDTSIRGPVSGNYDFVYATIYCTNGTISGVKHGPYGEYNTLYWILEPNGTLVIEGKGKMTNLFHDFTKYPWSSSAKEIKKIIIRNGVTSIATGAFGMMYNLQEVELPGSLETIGSVAFSDCTSLKSIKIPSSVREIGRSAFAGCDALTEIWLPQSIQAIGCHISEEQQINNSGCFPDSVTTVHYDGTQKDWINIAFCEGNQKLKELEIEGTEGTFAVRSGDCGADGSNAQWTLSEDGTLTITGTGAIKGCKSDSFDNLTFKESSPWPENLVKRVVIGEGITAIGDSAFIFSDNIGEVDLPSSLTSIARGSFAFCSKLHTINIPQQVSYIGEIALRDTAITEITLPEGIAAIWMGMFIDCTSLKSAVIPSTVTSIESNVFNGCDSLTDIHYRGTQEQWNAISIGKQNNALKNAAIHCIDGIPTTENSITTGKTDASGNTLHAVFNGLTAGEDYAVIVSKSAENPLDAANLIYINQKTAGAGGVLDVPFTSSESGATYVVACRRGSETQTKTKYTVTLKDYGGTSTGDISKEYEVGAPVRATYTTDPLDGRTFKCWRVVKGDITIENPESKVITFTMPAQDVVLEVVYNPAKPSNKPSDSSSSSTTTKQDDGGGAIVAVVLIGGVAAAVTAGVILMMPVEVSGVVQLGNGNVLANANVQLMKDGQQVAQTTTDESGHFALEVKRGEYQMNVTTVNPETGEQTVWTASVKAPAKNTNFVF